MKAGATDLASHKSRSAKLRVADDDQWVAIGCKYNDPTKKVLAGRSEIQVTDKGDLPRSGSLLHPVAIECGIMTTQTLLPPPQAANSRENSRAEPVDIWKARNFIGEHFGEELSLTQVAKAVNISPNYLSEKFKQVTGVNFVDHVARTRFEKARVLLPDVGLRVSEVAFAVGFQSLSQFNRVFKRLAGTSPTQYRVANSIVRRSG
jgi:AraC-like DNA-binding protein